MNTALLINALGAGILSLVFSWTIFSRNDSKVGSEEAKRGGQRYRPYIHGSLLPAYILTFILLCLMFYGTVPTAKMTLTMCFEISVLISLYYIILMPVLPFLRKHINARACAMLWLLPNYLYLTQQSYMTVPKPLIVIHAPGRLVEVLCIVWLLGAAAVFSWNIVRHLLFRRKILQNAVSVTDAEVMELLRAETEDAAIKRPKFQLVISPHVTTPLTIGLFKRSTKIVLPQESYSQDQLRLIFRHELIHIGRADSWAKFFMMFCTAMCWFDPLMWIAMKRSAEDVELSCDETVLLGADEDTRHRYADLILCTAGDDRGFTTCLSTSVSSMRYRLRSIVKPAKRRTGALLVGLTFFTLCMTCGYVSLAYGEDTGAVTVFRGHDLAGFAADTITVVGGDYVNGTDNIDADALTQYIAGLRTQEMTGNYSYSGDEKGLSIWYDSPYGIVLVDLYTDRIQVFYLSDEDNIQHVYHLPEPVDRGYIDSIVPPLPAAKVELSDGTQYRGPDLTATITKLVRKTDGTSVVLKDRQLQPDEGAGVYSSMVFSHATITFSMPPISPAEILIESWDYETGYTISQTDLSDSMTFELPDRPAHYTVTASFRGSDGVYDTTFRFHVGDVGRRQKLLMS